jgi:hypothetical protein
MSATIGLTVAAADGDDDYDDGGVRRAVGGMRIGWGNRNTRRKPAPVTLYPPQSLHYLTWDRTRLSMWEIVN